MARETRRERGSRLRYGICINEECELCKSKETQTIRQGHDFVCESCGKELRECAPVKETPWKKYVAIVAAVAVIGGGGAALILGGGSLENAEVVSGDSAQVQDAISLAVNADSVAEDTVEMPETEVQEADAESLGGEPTGITVEGGVDLGYAIFKGNMKDGKMNDDNGILTFKEKHIIEPRDVKKRTANAGEKVIGIFEDGHLVTGKLYKNDGNQEMIIP